MDAVFDAAIVKPVSQPKIVAGRRIGLANEFNLATNILVRITKLPGAIARLVAGPPMSERERYYQTVAEARARTFYGLASSRFRPH